MSVFKKKKEVSSSLIEVNLTAKFIEVKEAKTEEVEEATRLVHLKYSSCCGCGCHTIDFTRRVPVSSPLRKGDFVDEMEYDDDRG